jgi:hypothetical protein
MLRAMADELAKAITKIILPTLKSEGFVRRSAKNLIRVDAGICQLLYFQVSSWGDKTFCVTACANLIAGNEYVTLEPGFGSTAVRSSSYPHRLPRRPHSPRPSAWH